MADAIRRLRERVQSYLGNGGFFNPESMEHDKVRTLIIDLEAALAPLAGPVDASGDVADKCARCGHPRGNHRQILDPEADPKPRYFGYCHQCGREGKQFPATHHEFEASAPAAPTAPTTLILAHLTRQDFERFHAAHITYSGSTGPVARLEHYPTTGAYIATFPVNLVAALTALEWTHPDVRLEGQSLIVTRASIAPTWFCQQCAETFTNTRLAAAHSRDTYHVITSDPNRPSTPGGLADARSEDA